jgi:small subunit ribosomal protein S1
VDQANDLPTDEMNSDAVGGDEAQASSVPTQDSPEDEMSMMELLLEESGFMPGNFQRGALVEGIVVRKDKNQLTLDIGAKQEAVVPASDLMRLPSEVVDALKVGDTVRGVIMRPEGEIVISLYQALTVDDWDKAKALEESGEILELPIVGTNKGGILVQLGNLQGFIPRSHVAQGADEGDGSNRMGMVIPVKVIEVNQRKRRLIVSERQALREWRSAKKGRLLDALQEGETRTGTVSSVTDFGAFVDLGGADGLIHVSEITHERGRSPKDILKVGQSITVYILSIDRERSRIGLSLKRLQPDPWQTVERDHYVGELAEASIANLAKFGAFARLDDGLEGLIHISELSDGHVEHPREAVRVGQRVTVEIIAIDPERRRVGLSIRRVPTHLRTIDTSGEIEDPEENDLDGAETSASASPTDSPEVEAEESADAEATTVAADVAVDDAVAAVEPEPETETGATLEGESEAESEPEATAAVDDAPAGEAGDEDGANGAS